MSSSRPNQPSDASETRILPSAEMPAAGAATRVSDSGLAVPAPAAASLPRDELIARFNAAGTGFRLLRPLGEGGMGTVFVAEQLSPSREVALKLIHAAQATPEMRARFALEAEVLGRLKHPGIAEIHAAGEARLDGGGLPFLAMELVDGQPLNRWAREARPDLRTRLTVLAQICDAIEHAHQRGVIHRDLKPANILVTPEGQPKVLDFGVARVTDAAASPDSQLTTAGYVVGTLHYMSPEQTAGDSADVDTRSDVYALGVLGFELITGELPHVLVGRDPFAVVRAIREEAPRRAGQLQPAARGDVEIILDKALEKERERRYPSAGAMAEDIRRYLEDRSILARAPTLRYRLGKFARRNPALSGAIGVAVLSLVGAAVLVANFALSEQRARRLAEEEALKSNMTLNFFMNVLSKANPAFSRGQDLSVREALDSASADMAGALGSQPTVESRVRQTMGASFAALGRFAEAEREMRRAVAVAEANPAAVAAEERVSALRNLAEVLLTQGRLVEAREWVERARRESARLGPGKEDARVRIDHTSAMIGHQLGDAELDSAATADLLARAEAHAAMDHRLLAFARELHASRIEREDPEGSLALRRRALDDLRQRFGELSPDAISTADNLGTALLGMGRFDEALALREGLHAKAVQVLGAGHPVSLATGMNLAHAWQGLGDNERAVALLSELLPLAEGLPEGLDVRYRVMQGLSTALFAQGRMAEALEQSRAATAGFIRLYGEQHADSVLAMTSLASLLAQSDRYDEAGPWFAKAVEATTRNLGAEHPQTLQTLSEHAAFLRDAGRLEESLQAFAGLLKTLERLDGPSAPQTLVTLYQYGGALQQAGRHAEALPLSERLLRDAAATLGPGSPFTLLAPNRHARSLIGTGRLDEAEELLRSSWEALDRPDIAPQFRGFVAESFMQLAQARGDESEASRWRDRAIELGAIPRD